MCIVMRWLRNFRPHTYSTLTPSCSHGIALLPSLSQITRERRALPLKLMPRAIVSLIFSLAQTGPPIHRAIVEHGWEDVHLRGTLFWRYVYNTTLKVFSPNLLLQCATFCQVDPTKIMSIITGKEMHLPCKTLPTVTSSPLKWGKRILTFGSCIYIFLPNII